MNVGKSLIPGALVLAGMVGLGGLAAPSGATTLIRASLGDLAAGNETIVVAEVLDATSYWNRDGSFILTDVVVSPIETVKGKGETGEMVITLMGGTVGDLTTLIVGGPELVPGRSYVLFLNKEDLPGAENVRTVRDHSQGVFDVVHAKDEIRAISQASGSHLVPDTLGFFDAPGGAEGFAYDVMIESVRNLVTRQGVK